MLTACLSHTGMFLFDLDVLSYLSQILHLYLLSIVLGRDKKGKKNYTHKLVQNSNITDTPPQKKFSKHFWYSAVITMGVGRSHSECAVLFGQ